ncbi:MAG: hypothetical protein IPK79_10645 [Vampirovibrionales bacterium]|nr:hypothetical protein [Vampirovibrionales bacterium]
MPPSPAIESIGYLGPAGTHSHQAVLALSQDSRARAVFSGASLQPYPTLYALLEAVDAQAVAVALLPVENSLQGAVVESMEAVGLDRFSLNVHLECLLPIQHALIRQPQAAAADALNDTTTLAGLTGVMSHPQALAQCRETLRALLGPDVTLEPTASTADAVRQLALRDAAWAALGSREAARLHAMRVVREDVSDSPDNVTRFWLASSTRQTLRLPVWPDLPVKTSLCIGLQDRPGALMEILLGLKAYDLNMSRIESRPSRRRLGEYLFYVDVDGDLRDPRLERIVMFMEADKTYFRMTSAYPCLGALR